MEDNRDDLVVILAGYADRMEHFFSSNPGFRSRMAHHIEFPDYSDRELVAIGELMLREQNYRLSPAAKQPSPSTWHSAAGNRTSPTPAPCATPLTGPSSAKPSGW